jgi:hypothetical protein
MGLDLWFREDVARILASTHEAMRAAMGATAPLDIESAETYQQGFADALRAVAVAFGVTAPTVSESREWSPGPGYGTGYSTVPVAVRREPGGAWRQKTP